MFLYNGGSFMINYSESCISVAELYIEESESDIRNYLNILHKLSYPFHRFHDIYSK